MRKGPQIKQQQKATHGGLWLSSLTQLGAGVLVAVGPGAGPGSQSELLFNSHPKSAFSRFYSFSQMSEHEEVWPSVPVTTSPLGPQCHSLLACPCN